MNFGSDPEAFNLANDLNFAFEGYLKQYQPDLHSHHWSTTDFSNYYDSTGLKHIIFETVHCTMDRFDQDQWDKINTDFATILDQFQAMVGELSNYDMSDEDVSAEDRRAHCEVFENVITDMMCYAGLLQAQLVAAAVNETSRWSNYQSQRESFTTKLITGWESAIQATMILQNVLGYTGPQFTKWVVCNLIIVGDSQLRWDQPFYNEAWPIIPATVILQDRKLDDNGNLSQLQAPAVIAAMGPDGPNDKFTDEDGRTRVILAPQSFTVPIPFQTWFNLINASTREMLLFTRSGGSGYLYHAVHNALRHYELVHKADAANTARLTTLRADLFALVNLTLTYLEFITATICHPTTPTWVGILHTMGMCLWSVSLAACHEIKANGATAGGYDWEGYATRFAKLHVWAVWVMRNAVQPTSLCRAYVAAVVTDFNYQLFDRNLVLHAKAKAILDSDVYPILHEHCTNPNSFVDWVPLPLSKVKPTPAQITTFPNWAKIPALKTLQVWQDTGIVREYFDVKVAQYDNKVAGNVCPEGADRWETKKFDDVESTFSESDLSPDKKPNLWQYLPHDPKKDVDVNTVFGRVMYVSQGYDYRVKFVKTGADLTVTLHNVDCLARAPGKWRIITAGTPDVKLKVVKTGTYDFSVLIKD